MQPNSIRLVCFTRNGFGFIGNLVNNDMKCTLPGEHFESGRNAWPGKKGTFPRACRKPSELDLESCAAGGKTSQYASQ